MDKIIHYQFSKIINASSSAIIAEQNEKAIELAKARHNIVCKALAEKQRELSDYEAETIKVIRGESRLNIDLLNDLVGKAKDAVVQAQADVDAARQELDARQDSINAETKEFEKLTSWAALYDNCTFAAKKMIVSQFIKAVYVYRDYSLEVEFNVSFDEFKTLGAVCDDCAPNEVPKVTISA